jgi:DNA topoisomerase-1
MSTLLIVESPGKIKKIGEYLGSKYIVMASVGHIIDLDPKKLSVDLTTFEPLYKQNEDKKAVIEKLYKQAQKVGKMNILLAADEDREGEMIAWSLAKELDLTNAKRIVFNSITKKELEKAILNPRTVDMNLVKAQQARRILDRFAGFIISPILQKSTKGAESAGRVQSVVVKIVVDKEKEIEKFFSNKSDTFFTINSELMVGEYEVNTKLYNKMDKVDFDAKDEDFEDTESEKSENKKTKAKKNITTNNAPSKSCVIFSKDEEPQVIEIIKNMVKSEFKLLKMNERIRKSNPPAPFTTSTLQQTASQKFNMDAKRTMDVAQKLYEGGHITYMRTDSTAICEEEIKNIKEEITNKYGIEYYEKRDYKNKKSNTQEAHECVRPTKIYNDTIEGTPDEKRLYSMIWKRTIQSQMKAAEYQNITIEVEMLKRKILVPYKLVGNLEKLIFVGFLIVDNKKSSKSLSVEELKKLLIDWLTINGNEDTQKPPTRYNEASLTNKIDPKNLNIGRPSTYASIMNKIITRRYVEIKDISGKEIQINKYSVTKAEPKSIVLENKTVLIGKEKRKLVPTELGKNATDFLEKYFSKLMDYDFTANMEKQLDKVAEGKMDKIKVIKPFYDYMQEQINLIPPDVLKPINNNKFEAPIKIGNHENIDILLCNGSYGKYVVYNNLKFNLKKLFEKPKPKTNISNDLEAELKELEKNENKSSKSKSDNSNTDDNDTEIDLDKLSNKEIVEKTLEHLKKLKETNTKEWKIGKKKYILKNGEYGYYIEEWSITTNKKKGNYSLKFLINKIAKNNDLDISKNNDLNKTIELITNKDIEESVEYFLNNKKNKSAKFNKK